MKHENSRYGFNGFNNSVKTEIENNLPRASHCLGHKN